MLGNGRQPSPWRDKRGRRGDFSRRTHHMSCLISRFSEVFIALLLSAACGGSSAPVVHRLPGGNSPTATPPVLPRTIVLQGLSDPWDIAFAADGAMFFTEKCRGLSVRRP